MKQFFILILITVCTLSVSANITLPRLIANGMVLQRGSDIKIWGWAEKGESVKVSFLEHEKITSADENGNWMIELSDLKHGGPFQMILEGNNKIVIDDIYVGDVWLCGGQSNMDLRINRVKTLYEKEIKEANNKEIRHFLVHKKYDCKELYNDLESGEWQTATSENINNFSAVAYFFAQKLYEKYKIPIGLITNPVGGSAAESWMNEETLKQFTKYYDEAMYLKQDSAVEKIIETDTERYDRWYNAVASKDPGYVTNHWGLNEIDISGWDETIIPGMWSQNNIGEKNGAVWFKKEIELHGINEEEGHQLNLGVIVDSDSVWVNGIFVGNVTYRFPPRWYNIPANVLKNGKNTITIRVVNESEIGGFIEDKKYELITNNDTLDLTGTWKYKRAAEMDELKRFTYFFGKPLGLYNTMVYPLLNYTLKGIIWYQGESNTEFPLEYNQLFPEVIKNWRNDFNQGDIPFIYVQLANYMKQNEYPVESNWALVREAQLKTLEKLPNLAMAVTIDIGEWNDIHPLNKKDVGNRLALGAMKVAYNEVDILYSGPIYRKMEIDGNKIELYFDNVGSGLISKNGNLKRFQIAGADKKFVWADAVIKDGKIEVSNKKIMKPVAVRYAWSDNPEGANLYNNEGLPASPFRTDNW